MEKKKSPVKKQTKKVAQQAKESAQKGKRKIDEARKTSAWKKIKSGVKKTARIASSHLATLRVSVTLSNEESELINKLKDELNKKSVYPSKSEIVHAGLWNLRKMNAKELENSVKDLLKVKQTRIL